MFINEDQAHSYLAGPVIKVIVNEDKASRTFYVHHDLMVSRSCFFRNALKKHEETGNSVWLESQEGIVRLPEVDPEVFARYIQLLYQDRLPIYKTIPNVDVECSQALGNAVDKMMEQAYELLAKLYVLCEMLQDSTSQELLVHAFVEMSHEVQADGQVHFPACNAIQYVYNKTLELYPLRELLVDFYVYNADSGWFEEINMDDFPRQFINAVVKSVFKERGHPEGPEKLQNGSFYCEKLRHAEKSRHENL